MAAKLNALIIPFASVGADEAFDIALDSSEVLKTPILGNLMRGFMRNVDPNLNLDESVPPLTSIPGLGIPSLLPIPNLSRLYFRSGLAQMLGRACSLSAGSEISRSSENLKVMSKADKDHTIA